MPREASSPSSAAQATGIRAACSRLCDPDGDGIYSFETSKRYRRGRGRGEGRDQRELGRELRSGGVPERAEHRVQCPVAGAKYLLRRGIARAHDRRQCPWRARRPRRPLPLRDLARKDCLGTARNTRSKVWYTVANGVRRRSAYPTIDNTNLETLQYVVTDGSTFTDLDARHDLRRAGVYNAGGMVCEVTATAKSGRYRIETATSPTRTGTCTMRASSSRAIRYRLYVRFDPTVNGTTAAARERRGRLRHGGRLDRPSRPRLVGSRSPRRTPSTVITPSLSTRRWTARSARRRAASSAPPATGSSSSTPRTRRQTPTPTLATSSRRLASSWTTADRPCSRSASARPRRGGRHGRRVARPRLHHGARGLQGGLKQYDNSLLKPRTEMLPGTARTGSSSRTRTT